MSDDDVTGRDLRTIWRTIAIVLVGGGAVAGAVVGGIVREVRQDARIEAVERWQRDRDDEVRQQKRREMWRREREKLKPTQGVIRRQFDVRIVEIEGERWAVLPELDLLSIVSGADTLAAELAKTEGVRLDMNDDVDGWKFAALVAGACAVGAILVLVVTALARHL